MSTAYLTQDNDLPPSNYNVIVPYPKLFKLRCVEATFGKSKVRTDDASGEQTGGNPMITLDWEVIEPQTVMVTDPETITAENPKGEKKQYSVAGLRVRSWITLTAKAAGHIKAYCSRKGISVDPATLDDENPNYKQFEGKEDYGMIKSKADFAVDAESGEFIIIPDSITPENPAGKRKVTYSHKLAEWV